jgi:glutamine synthetase
MSGNMSRVQAIQLIASREPKPAKAPKKLEEMWAVDVFNLEKMQKSLPGNVFESKPVNLWMVP